MYILPLFGITVGVNIVILNKVKEFSMVDFDDMKNKAEEENWDDKAREEAIGKFNHDDKQGQNDQNYNSDD
jgi:hypothetical protein